MLIFFNFQCDGLKKLIFINYIVAATFQVFIYALAGSRLEDACLNIQVVAYNLPWYTMNKHNRLLVRMMIMRAQKPALIKVPFVTASFATFSVVSCLYLLHVLCIKIDKLYRFARQPARM